MIHESLISDDKRTYFIEEDFKIKLYFSSIPSEKIRDVLKLYNWRWDKYGKCWNNKKTEENRNFAISICKELNPVSINPLDELPVATISVFDLVVRCNGFYCNQHHEVIDVAGLIEIIGKGGKRITKRIPLAYCKTCNIYYILEETYRENKKYGVLTCQILRKKDYDEFGRFDDSVQHWKKESILKLLGYTTSKEAGLTTEQRQAVLENILRKKFMTKDRILSYLDFFINLNSNEDSIYCWKEDRRFVENLKIMPPHSRDFSRELGGISCIL